MGAARTYEGLVVGQPATVAAEYTATVREVFVKEGQEINKGDVVAQISSQAIVESRARLTSDYALRVSKLAALKARGEVVEATLTSAEARERSAVEGKAQLDTIDRKGFLPILTRTTPAEQAYRGKQDAESLRSEQRALTGQRQEVTAATEEADAALHDLNMLYDSGKMRAPEKGMVSMVLAHPAHEFPANLIVVRGSRCCARAASGHAAATPMSVMNLRRCS
jgi:HlyD family secretion protein